MKTSILLAAFLVSVVSAETTTTPAPLHSEKRLHQRQPQAEATLLYLEPEIIEPGDQWKIMEADDEATTTATATTTPPISDELKSKLLTPVTKPVVATKTVKAKTYTSNGSVCIVEAKATKCHKIPNINKTGRPKENTRAITTTATPTNGAERCAGNGALLGAAVAVAGAAVVGL